MSLFSSAVDAVAGTVTSVADTFTGTSPSSDSPSSDPSTTTTSAPAVTTAAPATTTPTPTTTTATPTPTTATPTPTTATPTPTTTAPTPTTAAPTAAMSPSTAVASESVSTESSSAESASSVGSVGTSSQSASSQSAPRYTWGESNSLRGDSASANQDEVVVNDSQGVSMGAIVGIVVSAVVIVLLLAVLLVWFYRREQRKRKRNAVPPLTGHRSVLAMGSSTGRAQRSEPTPKGPFAPFHTANLDTSSSSGSSNNLIPGEPWEDPDITAMRLPLEKLSVGRLLNEGGHGVVYRGVYRGEAVAVKKLLPESRKVMRQINIFLAEIKLMATIEHPRVVRFIGVGWDSLSDLSAVSEYMEGGDLYRLLKHFDQTELREHGFDLDKARIALNVAHALTYLHSLDPVVMHRDLKSLNILLSSNLEAKITDFGVSRKWTVDTMTAGVGTFLWMAPEVMAGKRYNASADIFSFGIVLCEMDWHLPPYSSVRETRPGQRISDMALMELVTSGQLRIEFSPNAPKAVVDLGHACVQLDPAKRPSASDLLYRLQGILRMYEGYTI